MILFKIFFVFAWAFVTDVCVFAPIYLAGRILKLIFYKPKTKKPRIMKRVMLSTWMLCAQTKVRMEKNTLAYQDLETKKVYSLCSDKVREWLSGGDGSIIPNEEPVDREDR